MSLTLTDIVGLLIIYQSLVFVFSLLFNKKSKPLFVKILLTFCLIIISHFGYMLYETYVPGNQILLGPFFGLCYGPVYYMYTKSLIVETSNLKKFSLHLIPAFMAMLLSVFFGKLLANFIDGIGLVVTLHFIVYLFISLALLFKYREQLKKTTSSFYNISLFWLEIMIYLQLTTIVVMLLENYFQSTIATNTFILIIYILTLILIHCFYYLGLKQLRLFRGFKEENVITVIPKGYAIPEEVFNSYLNKLNTYFEKEKPYLEFDISLKDISDKLAISPRNLSHVINKEFKRNFYDFINHYRLELVKQNLQASEKPIKEIMYDSGFSNKATFNSIFKKSTGLTPTQFRRSQKS